MASQVDRALNINRIGPIAGILFVIALIATFPFTPSPSHNTIASVTSEFAKHHNRILFGEGVSLLIVVFFPIFLLGLWSRLRRDTPSGWLVTLAVIAGLLTLLMENTSAAVYAALANSVVLGSSIAPSTFFAIYKVGALIADFANPLFGVFSIAAGGAILLNPDRRGRWVGWIALLAGVLVLISGFGVEDEMFSGVGFAGFIGFILSLLWVLIYSIMALLRGAGVQVPEPAI